MEKSQSEGKQVLHERGFNFTSLTVSQYHFDLTIRHLIAYKLFHFSLTIGVQRFSLIIFILLFEITLSFFFITAFVLSTALQFKESRKTLIITLRFKNANNTVLFDIKIENKILNLASASPYMPNRKLLVYDPKYFLAYDYCDLRSIILTQYKAYALT